MICLLREGLLLSCKRTGIAAVLMHNKALMKKAFLTEGFFFANKVVYTTNFAGSFKVDAP